MPISIPSNTLEKFTTFGDLLRFLRRRVGLNQIELANAVGYSNTQISRLEQNLRLPDISVIQSHFISALGLEDEPKAVARLLDLAANVRREDAPTLGLCPYKGLNYFDETDADLFVGREALTARLVERVFSLTLRGSVQETRLLAIIGASGSGKSSLVRAGLVPALRWNKETVDWHIHILTPTAHPLESLAATLTHETNSVTTTANLMNDLGHDSRSLQVFANENISLGNGARLLLVVDQFEELFALCHLEEERAAFIDNLLTAASETNGPIMIVIALRADFYAACANYPQLREALANYQEYIGAMNDEEIRRAIEEPAQRGHWEFEPGLVDVLLHDVGHEPGALPLLSHALFETWQRRRGPTMTLSGYASSGGVRGAIAETAETVFADQFTNEQRAIARRIFLRLTELSDEASVADTRRRASFDELILKPEEASTTREVLKALADARLIITTEDAAEVAHEALIREWPTLRGWLEENRDSLRLHRQITEAAQEWLETDRTPDLLYRGARLAQAREWRATHQDEINLLEREFLTASIEASEREAAEREEGRQRELTSAKELAETQRQFASRLRTRNRAITAVGFIAIILAMLAGTFALQSRNEKRIAISRELASAAVSSLRADSELSMMLAVQALDTAYTREAEDVLHRALQSSRVRMTLSGHTGGVRSVDISPDGKSLAAASYEDEVTVWETVSGQKLFSLTGSIARYNPDGTRLAIGGEDGFVTIWDIATQKELLTMKGYNENEGMRVIPYKRIVDVNFSPDGKLLASANWDGSYKVWDTEAGVEMFSSQSSASFTYGYLLGFEKNRLTFSADGKLLIGLDNMDEGSKLSFWSVERDWELLNQQTSSDLMIFSRDGKWLVSREGTWYFNDMGGIALWDISNINLENLDLSTSEAFVLSSARESAITKFAFNPDASMLASIGSDGMVKVWKLTSKGAELRMAFSSQTEALTDVAFSPDGTRLATAGGDGLVRLWDITPEGVLEWFTTAAHEKDIYGLALTQDGKYLASASLDGTAKVWELASGRELLAITGHGGSPGGFGISPDGSLLATANKIWQLHLDSEPPTAELLRRLSGRSVAFSPDSTKLATGWGNGRVKIWDAAMGQGLFSAAAHSQGIMDLAFSPDGNLLAIAGDSPDALAKVWDVASGKEISTFLSHENRGWGIGDIVFSPNGKYVATVSGDGSLKIWDARTGEESLVLIDATDINGVDFSPNGKYLATVSSDGTATKWDASTGEELVVYRVPGIPLSHVKITPDGKKIIVAGAGHIYGYIFDLEETIRLARSRLTRWFTLDECRKYLHREECPRP
jgi:WD40 repeat protein/transcriptional regulator with XRE-family HTH domain